MERTIQFKHVAAEALWSLNPLIKKTIKAYIKQLATHPNPGKELQGELEGYRSDKVGKYRIIFTLQKNIFEVEYIGHRKDVYQRVERILKDKNHQRE